MVRIFQTSRHSEPGVARKLVSRDLRTIFHLQRQWELGIWKERSTHNR
jgi:hypothetical protein